VGGGKPVAEVGSSVVVCGFGMGWICKDGWEKVQGGGIGGKVW